MIAKFLMWVRKKLQRPTKDLIVLTLAGNLAVSMAFSLFLPGLIPSSVRVGYFFVAEYTFLQVNFQVVLLEPLKYLFQGLEMSFMGVGVDKQIINVEDNVLKVPEYSFHKSLKQRRAPQKSHR